MMDFNDCDAKMYGPILAQIGDLGISYSGLEKYFECGKQSPEDLLSTGLIKKQEKKPGRIHLGFATMNVQSAPVYELTETGKEVLRMYNEIVLPAMTLIGEDK